MLALSFGLTAALIWAVHDLLARKVSQKARLLPIVAVVLAAGTAVLGPVAVIQGDWGAMTGRAIVISVAYGVTYAVAIGALYRAFSLAPARLVSPVIGAYPMLSLGIAVAQGRTVTPSEWLAVLVIVAGIAIVAISTRNDSGEGYAAAPAVALGWSAFSAVGFAASFALGQEATREGADLPVMLIGRLVALATILAVALGQRFSLRPASGQGWFLVVMGVLDVVALGLVTASGALPKAEYAAVAASLFGVLTVILAAWFLKERTRPIQWLGIATVFSGIAALTQQH
jgi:drug/metabolite transporter (DMT)-like permease